MEKCFSEKRKKNIDFFFCLCDSEGKEERQKGKGFCMSEVHSDQGAPLFGLRTLRKELIWYYIGVFLGTGSAGWSMWINIDNALVPVTADIRNASGKIITAAWGWEQYVDKYVLMALLLGGITTIGAFLITHYGRFLSLWKKKAEIEGKGESWARWMNRGMVIGALLVILGAEVLGRGLVYFTNPGQNTSPETWFLAIASLLFFMIPALLSPSVEQIYEQNATSSELEDQNLKVKELNEWRRKQLIREYKKKVKPFWFFFWKKKPGMYANMTPEELAAAIDSITPGARRVLPLVGNEEDSVLSGRTLVKEIRGIPELVSGAVTRALSEKREDDNPEPTPPSPSGGGLPFEEQTKNTILEEANEIVARSTVEVPYGEEVPVKVMKRPGAFFDLSLLDEEKKAEPEPLPENIRSIRPDVVVQKKLGRPKGSTKEKMLERRRQQQNVMNQ